MDLYKKIETANCYKFFADCFYFPQESQISLIKEHNLKISESCQSLINTLNNIDVDRLKVDYSKLFIGPFKVLAPPYGSIYLESEKKVNGESTTEIRNLYNEENLKVELKEPVDHIAIELEFMYYLILKELDSYEKEEFEKSSSYLKKQKTLINSHLSVWIPDFTNEVINHAETKFYKYLALLLNEFVTNEYLRINKEQINYEVK